MEEQPKRKLTKTKSDTSSIRELNNRLDNHSEETKMILKELHEIKTALMGDTITNNGGLVQRVISLERDKQLINDKLVAVEKDMNKIKWIGMVVVAIPTILQSLDYVFKLFSK